MTFSESDLNDWDGWIEGHAKIPTGTVAVSRVKDLIDEIWRLQKENLFLQNRSDSLTQVLQAAYSPAYFGEIIQDTVLRLIRLGKAVEAMPKESILAHEDNEEVCKRGKSFPDWRFEFKDVEKGYEYFYRKTPLEALQAAKDKEIHQAISERRDNYLKDIEQVTFLPTSSKENE